MATVVKTIGIIGIHGYSIDVQVKVLNGQTVMNIVGLGDQAVNEAKDRIESACDHLGFVFPKKKIIVNLSPSEVKKSGTYFDLPMLIGLLIETEQIEPSGIIMDQTVFLGEVGLNCELNHFHGVLPMAIEAKNKGYKNMVLPLESLYEASRVKGIKLFGFAFLNEAIRWMERRLKYKEPDLCPRKKQSKPSGDYAEVLGQNHMMGYITAAAAGNHNLLMIGPPGCGKSMIAKRFPSILPDLSEEEMLEVMIIQSVAGLLKDSQSLLSRPFRAPHYNTSPNAIIGGGTNAMPGEISLAHNGVLFLDELPEFSRQTIDALRQPLQDRCVTVARVRQTNTFPASFLLLAAMNPCKCGYLGSSQCVCSVKDIKKYRQRVSGPIYDRLDIQKYLGQVNIMALDQQTSSHTSADIKSRVIDARQIQMKRFSEYPDIRTNSQMESKHISKFCVLDSACRIRMQKAHETYNFSVRAYNKVLALARTFADLEQSEKIRESDLVSALMGRDLDKENALGLSR